MSAHSVFVLASDGTPLTPTTPAKARKLLRAGVAEKVWSKFGTFGIRLLTETRRATPRTAVGVDHGTKFEGYSVVVDRENNRNVKLDLPDKKTVLRKLEDRRDLRRARRFRKCRRRPCRSDNRSRKGFLAPSQKVIVDSRLKIIRELCRIYPVSVAGIEDVCFHHAAKRWGANFSTVEIGKTKIREFLVDRHVNVTEYKGHETQELRQGFGYRKTKDKSEDRFESHCSDSLSLACATGSGIRLEPGPFFTVDDTYRPVRRRLHDTQPSQGGIREPYSTGTVAGLRKGLLIGTPRGPGRLCGINKGSLRYHDQSGKRQSVKAAIWISSSFVMRRKDGDSPAS
jgi:RRXRR protein